MFLSSVEKLGKAVRFRGNIFISTIAPTSTDMHIASVMGVDKLLILFFGTCVSYFQLRNQNALIVN